MSRGSRLFWGVILVAQLLSVTQLTALGWISFMGSVLQDSVQLANANKGATAGIIVGAAGVAAGIAVYHRYWSLRRVALQLRPPVGEDDMRWGKKIYNWRMHDQYFNTAAKLRSQQNRDEVINLLRQECSLFDILKREDVNGGVLRRPITGGAIRWCDLLATIEVEQRELGRLRSTLRSYVDWSFGDLHFLGALKDYQQICTAQGVRNQDDEHAMNVAQEQAIDQVMRNKQIDRFERIIFGLSGSVNYSFAYPLYWLAYQRCARLRQLHAIVHMAASNEGFNKVIATKVGRGEGRFTANLHFQGPVNDGGAPPAGPPPPRH